MHQAVSISGVLLTAIALHVGAEQLVVDVAGIDIAGGHMMIAVHDDPRSWENGDGAVTMLRAPVRETTLQVVVEGLVPGRHAVMLYHDLNDNGKLDRNMLGIPSEGYGFSNNPISMGRPSFADAAFEFKSGQRLRIDLR